MVKFMIDRERQILHSNKKGEILKGIFKYIIKYQYKKLKLKELLKKLDKMFATQRKQLVLNSVILIQYHTRRMLKRLREKRAKAAKQKSKVKARKNSRRIKPVKRRSNKFKIVNRRGKIMKVDIKEETRQKEEQKKRFDELVRHQDQSTLSLIQTTPMDRKIS